MQGKAAMMALSSRPWLGHFDLANRFALSPLSYEPLEHAAPFSSDACPEGVVAVAGNTLRIVAVERLGEQFNQRTCKLRYTPRQMSVNVDRNTLAVVECDQSSVPYDERTGSEGAAGEKDTKMDVEGEEDEEEDDFTMTPAEQFGAPKAPPGSWASIVYRRPGVGVHQANRGDDGQRGGPVLLPRVLPSG